MERQSCLHATFGVGLHLSEGDRAVFSQVHNSERIQGPVGISRATVGLEDHSKGQVTAGREATGARDRSTRHHMEGVGKLVKPTRRADDSGRGAPLGQR